MARDEGKRRAKVNALGATRRAWRSWSAVVLIASGLSTGIAAAVEREGMHYEDSIRIGGSQAVLNGVGVRGGFIKGYVAGLYLAEKATDAGKVYELGGAKRIAVRMLLDADGALLARTFADGIRKNYKDDALVPLAARMETFDREVRALGGVKKGDAIDLDYEPASGTHLRVNGKPHGEAIAGDDFYVALLKMFIGERAVDKNLRAALLGQDGVGVK